MDDEIIFEAVSSACTDELPVGDAALAWKKLKSIYIKHQRAGQCKYSCGIN